MKKQGLEVPFPGVDNSQGSRGPLTIKHNKYYQWVAFTLFFQVSRNTFIHVFIYAFNVDSNREFYRKMFFVYFWILQILSCVQFSLEDLIHSSFCKNVEYYFSLFPHVGALQMYSWSENEIIICIKPGYSYSMYNKLVKTSASSSGLMYVLGMFYLWHCRMSGLSGIDVGFTIAWKRPQKPLKQAASIQFDYVS